MRGLLIEWLEAALSFLLGTPAYPPPMSDEEFEEITDERLDLLPKAASKQDQP